MSVKAMSWAWEQTIDPTAKFILVALSDHANDVDFTCWPSLTHLVAKTGFSRPTIWKTIDRLAEIGFIVRVGVHASGATLYKVSVGKQITLGKEITQVTTLPDLGNDVNQVGNVVNKLGNDVTPNHKNHHEPSINHHKDKTKSTRFKKPTLEEVEAYCQERKNGISAVAFIAHYDSKGWVIGKSPVKDWKACVITWEQKKRASSPTPSGRPADNKPHVKPFPMRGARA